MRFFSVPDEKPTKMAEETSSQQGNVGIAFGMTIGAGLCTTLGAALAFCAPVENKRFLAVSLAVAAGVMVYVSMVEIFFKSLNALSAEWCPNRHVGEICSKAYGVTTAFFFAGLALCALLNLFTHNLEHILPYCCPCILKRNDRANIGESLEESSLEHPCDGNILPMSIIRDSRESNFAADAVQLPEGWKIELSRSKGKPFFSNVHTGEIRWEVPSGTEQTVGGIEISCEPVVPAGRPGGDIPSMVCACSVEGPQARDDGNVSTGLVSNTDTSKKQLVSTGLLTGLAIAIHNFPEGLATFVAAMADSSLGAAIAVAISIHNIPEGVCVAMPVYYATGSKWKAFFWATLSGVSEPIGALFGYAVLAGEVSNVAYGSMFGLVAGMMVYISLAELLPAAYRHDHNPVVITSGLVFGMVAMALSLVLFVL